jgi:hypothetical protein
MKAKQNKNKNIAIDFSVLDTAMLGVHKAEVVLMDTLMALWNEYQGKVEPLVFREAFITHAVSKGYDRRWAMETIVEAGVRLYESKGEKNIFRARAAGGGRKASTSKPSTSKPSTSKPTKASDVDLSQMPKGELVKLMASIAARL